MASQTGSQLFIGGALKGYASKMMNNLDITLHKDRAIIAAIALVSDLTPLGT